MQTETADLTYGDAEAQARVGRSMPLQRMGTPEEQAEAICFLASPAASFITGAVLMCDGGITANAGVFPPPLKED